MLKKSLLLLLAVVVVISFSYSSSITIISPHNGEVWYKGLTYTIKWTKSGSMYSKVKIRLYRGNMKIIGITDSTPNDGSFSWKVPDTIAPGTYYIRVKTVDNKVFDNSSLVKIENTTLFNSSKKFGSSKNNSYGLTKSNILKGAKLKIQVLSPSKNNLWVEDNTYKIIWEKQKNTNETFNLYLVNKNNDKNIVKTIITNYQNSGSRGIYKWYIPVHFFSNPASYNKQYRILVRTYTGDNYGTSGAFMIKMKEVSKKYKIPAKVKWEELEKFRILKPETGSFEHKEKSTFGQGEPAKVGISYAAILSGDGTLYRSQLIFNLNSLSSEKVIKKAILYMTHTKGANCGITVNKILEQKTAKELFKGVKLQSIIGKYPIEITNTVKEWVINSSSNKGLMLIGKDETLTDKRKDCVEYFNNIYLEVEVLERNK